MKFEPVKFDQMAIYTDDLDASIAAYKKLGYNEWTFDDVQANVVVYRDGNAHTGVNIARLAFNYQMGPFEFELLQYIQGPHWHEGRQRHGQISHMGIHVDDPHVFIAAYGLDPIIQEAWTRDHTNPFVIETGRHYHYIIFDTREDLGFDVKLIQRI